MLFQLASTAVILNHLSQADLAQEYQRTGSNEALNKLIESTVRLVIKLAKRYQRSGVDFEDLVAEGTIGVMDAAGKFNPSENVKFSNYAALWIKARIMQHVAANSSTITVSGRLGRELQAKLPKLRRMFGPELDAETIASAIDADIDDVREALGYLNVRAASLDKPLNASGGTIATLVSDGRMSAEQELADVQEKNNLRARLDAFAATLEPRRRAIFTRNMLAEEPVQLLDIAKEMGVSKQRASQLKKEVEKALRAYMS
jgi:RNA polymerase sigma factor (sigma-70 family)